MRKSRPVQVKHVQIGGGAPVVIQSMTKTDTANVDETVMQIEEMVTAGCEIVRLAVPDNDAAVALKEIRRRVPEVPLVADIHFHYKLALMALEAGVDKLRLNPGNIGSIERVREVVRATKERGVPIRIGVNGGSLEKDLLKKYGTATPEAMVESALRHIAILEDLDFRDIVVSLKASDVHRTVAAYRLLAVRAARRCELRRDSHGDRAAARAHRAAPSPLDHGLRGQRPRRGSRLATRRHVRQGRRHDLQGRKAAQESLGRGHRRSVRRRDRKARRRRAEGTGERFAGACAD